MPSLPNAPSWQTPTVRWICARRSSTPWPYLQLEARLLRQMGKADEAMERVATAARHAQVLDQLLKSVALERAFRGEGRPGDAKR